MTGLLDRELRREAGHLGISDLLVVVLIADAAQNAMVGGLLIRHDESMKP
ncbi:MAG: hypothetical protein PHF20_06295 [Halothiobacillaceae bacterium]|nr:hypothetical protein [Halothiobacillaceae bacterium]